MKKFKSKRLPFTAENVISSFSEVTGIDPARLSVEGDLDSSALSCTLYVEGPVLGDLAIEDVSVYRDQKALDKCSADDLRYDESDGFYDVGNLSAEDILRYAAKGCVLSDLKHWIISQGRDDDLSDEEIKVQLKRPLETLIEHYRQYDMEGAFSTLISQCRSDESEMARHLLKFVGGAQKVWTDELYEELPGGFIVHIIPAQDISLFRQLVDVAKKKLGPSAG